MKRILFAPVFWLILGAIWLNTNQPVLGQYAMITKVIHKQQATNERLEFRITAPVQVKKEYFPQSHAVLVKILGAAFNPEFSQDLIRSIKRSPLHPNVAQINETSIFILFKGIDPSKVGISQKPHLLRIRIQKKSPPTAYGSQLRKGIELVKEKKFKAALLYLRRALRYRPKDPVAYFWAGKARFALGQWKAAQYNLKQAQKHPKLKAEATRLLAFIQAKESEKGIEKLQPIAHPETLPLTALQAKRSEASRLLERTPSTPKLHPSIKVASQETTHLVSPGKTHARGPSLFQILLFLAIVATVLALPFVFFLSRMSRKPKKIAGVSFEKNLEAFQVQQQRMMQEIQKTSQPMPVENERPFNGRRARQTGSKEKAATEFNWREEPLLRNPYSDSELVRKARKFSSRGYTNDEIAQKLGIGKGELQLMMRLSGEKIRGARQPGLRLMFDEDR